jgi:TatD DNase family protein
MTLIDSHCHLESFHRAGALDSTLAEAEAAGVGGVVTIGTEPEDWPLYRDIARERPGRVWHTVGLHPCSVGADWENAVAQIEAFFAGEPRPVALGEVGLDYFHLPADASAAEAAKRHQHDAFRAQIALARQLGVPLVIHARKAFADCVRLLDEGDADWRGVVFHCFSEGAEEVRELNRRGGRASFTGVLTYPNAVNVREAALAQGLPLCMVETDAPYLAPQAVRGKRCQPAHTRLTAEFAANLFGIGLDEFAAATLAATRDFYRLAFLG